MVANMARMNDCLERRTSRLAAVVAACGMNVHGAVLTLIVGFAAAGWLGRATTRAMKKAGNIDPMFQPLPGKIVRVAVKVDGNVCIIDQFGFFICKAHLPDGPTAYLPNSRIWGQTIINYPVTDQDIRRIDEHYGIGYGDDIEAALAILKKIVADDARILKEPAPLIIVDSLGDSSVNILFRVWTARRRQPTPAPGGGRMHRPRRSGEYAGRN
jgi:Mechanosensitive ion channel